MVRSFITLDRLEMYMLWLRTITFVSCLAFASQILSRDTHDKTGNFDCHLRVYFEYNLLCDMIGEV